MTLKSKNNYILFNVLILMIWRTSEDSKMDLLKNVQVDQKLINLLTGLGLKLGHMRLEKNFYKTKSFKFCFNFKIILSFLVRKKTLCQILASRWWMIQTFKTDYIFLEVKQKVHCCFYKLHLIQGIKLNHYWNLVFRAKTLTILYGLLTKKGVYPLQ